MKQTTLTAMSEKKRKNSLNKEELDIQQVLSPGSQNEPSVITPGQPEPSAPPPASLSMDCMKDLAGIISKSISNSMAEIFHDSGMFDREQKQEQESDEWSEQGDFIGDDAFEGFDLPMHGPSGSREAYDFNEKSHRNVLPQFGAVNEPANSIVIEVPKIDIHKSDGAVDNSPAVVEPDETLPSARSSRAPTNWYPHEKVLAWAAKMVDDCEWTEADRDSFAKDFSPNVIHDHIFTAVECPKDMLDALKLPEIKKKDYLFKRYETEEFLHDANKDIVCGFRPLIEVLSNIRDVSGQEHNRNLLANVFQCMASAASRITRGRRELGRRFVPLENSSALFNTKPSHFSFFGDSSDETAVTKAVAVSKVNKNLVILPKKRKYTYCNKYSQSGSKAYYNQKSNYGNYPFRQNYSSSARGKFRSNSRGRGRGTRRSRPKTQQYSSKPSTQQ